GTHERVTQEPREVSMPRASGTIDASNTSSIEQRDVGVPHMSDDAGELVRRTPPSKARHRGTDLLEGTMTETPSSNTISTKLERIAKLAKEPPKAPLTTLAHYIDVTWLREA